MTLYSFTVAVSIGYNNYYITLFFERPVLPLLLQLFGYYRFIYVTIRGINVLQRNRAVWAGKCHGNESERRF